MVNFETDPQRIKAAADKGIITKEDYEKWLGVQGYKTMLKKSREDSEISTSVFADESEKAESYFFERDLSSNQFRFILKGVDFQPLDLFKQHTVIKAMQQAPLVRNQPARVKNLNTEISEGIRKGMESANNLLAFAKETVKKNELRKSKQQSELQ